LITALGHAVCHIGELVFTGAMVAIMLEFALEPYHVTAMALLGYVLMGVGALPVGVWSDAWGHTRVLLLYFLGMAVAGLGVALAPNVWLLFGALTGLGLAASIYHPTGLAMISLGVQARGRAMGINGVAGSLGVATGPLLGLLAASWGMWRLAYWILAALALAGGLFLFLAGGKHLWSAPKPKARAGRSPVRHLPVSAATGLPGTIGRSPGSFWPLVWLMVVMMLGGFNYRCLVTALPTFLSGETAAGGDLARGGLFAFIALLAGGFGQYFGGWVADNLGGKRVYVGLVSALVPLTVLLSFLGGTPYAVLVACLVAFCLFAQQPVENVLLAEATSSGRRSASYGTKFALTFGVGALGAQVAGVVWHECHSLGPVFALIAVSATVMAVLLAKVWRRVRADEL
jgi:MFS family permease